MSKETVAQIGKAIEEAQGAKDLREQQEAARREAEEFRQGTEYQALIAQNEARLRATGVVALFEELRDSGTLKLEEKMRVEIHSTKSFLGIEWPVVEERIEDYKPAIITLYGNGIRMEFDKGYYYVGKSFEDQETAVYYPRTSFLVAEITESGVLKINEHEMKPEERLGDVVRDEILREKGLKK